MSPFLSIVTRHMPSRPGLFAECCRSLRDQADQDFEHVVLVDHVGRGVQWANGQFARHRYAVNGDYVLILDDDDALTTPHAVEALRAGVADSQADLIVFRADHANLGILPDAAVWSEKPLYGHIGSCDFITRREVWQRHVDAFAKPVGGDYSFLSELWRCGYHVHWLDCLLARVQRISRGAPE
jgi:glycosyltransferase involved in cell wall biosynthesis